MKDILILVLKNEFFVQISGETILRKLTKLFVVENIDPETIKKLILKNFARIAFISSQFPFSSQSPTLKEMNSRYQL